VLVVLMMAGVRACKSRKPAEEDPLKDLGPGLYQPKQTGDKLPVPAPAPAPTPPAKK
jgi:hypothetical protein